MFPESELLLRIRFVWSLVDVSDPQQLQIGMKCVIIKHGLNLNVAVFHGCLIIFLSFSIMLNIRDTPFFSCQLLAGELRKLSG